MGIKEKIKKKQEQWVWDKYGDKYVALQGVILSIKPVEQKSFLFFIHKVKISFVIKLDKNRLGFNTGRDKSVISCLYLRRTFFKKPKFISLSAGNSALVLGLKNIHKGKKGEPGKEYVQVINIKNLTTKEEIAPMPEVKTSQQYQRIK